MRLPFRAGTVIEGPTAPVLFNWPSTQCLLPSVCHTPLMSAVLTGSSSAPGIPGLFKGREGGAAGGEEAGGAAGRDSAASEAIFFSKTSRSFAGEVDVDELEVEGNFVHTRFLKFAGLEVEHFVLRDGGSVVSSIFNLDPRSAAVPRTWARSEAKVARFFEAAAGSGKDPLPVAARALAKDEFGAC